MAKHLLNAFLIIVSLIYPVAVYVGLQTYGLKSLAALLLLMSVLHLVNVLRGKKQSYLWLFVCIALAAWTWQQQTTLGLKLYPLFINLGMLTIFAWSLVSPPTAIERLARLSEPDLPPEGVAYTRKVTQVWCGFFIANGAVSAYLSFFASDELWALYNGLIAYILMGLLFAVEWLVRIRVRSRTEAGL